MRQINWEELAPRTCQIAIKAGNAIMEIYEKSKKNELVVTQKEDKSPLTEADLASHNVICDSLHNLTPNVPIVSEEDKESLQHRTPTGSFWLIDPLDGTKEFLAHNGQFTVNIAFITNGEPVWGVVVAPEPGITYWGGKSHGSYRKDSEQSRQIQASPPTTPDSTYRVVASKNHLNEETSAFINRLGKVNVIQAGSSLKICRIAENKADIYPRLAPTCEWDTAAAQAVLEGAGGYIYDTRGERLGYGKTNVLNPHFIASSIPFNQLPK